MADTAQSSTNAIPYEDMLKSGMHFGRKKTVFNPKMKDYVFIVRDGICIIDLLKTQSQLGQATEFMKEITQKGGLILFVALTKQSITATKELAEALNMPYVVERWLGGTLTNFKVISGRIKQFEELEKSQKEGALEKYTKKEKLVIENELKKMRQKFEGLKRLTRIPDAVFVTSLKESALPIREARLMKVKVVGIANTDSDPSGIDYAIPANDRSKKSVDLIINALKDHLSNV
ncbi:MAG: 30S ribosomal protein S2 [Candidatus Yanofskybacteria bacterium RIFCSPHIGHO2_01_FULL_45_42]|uniref:Small ribosomal subunit protein uS2 n=3 Tax=Candidatus Yanofskyibacteriota TaxID=1752733 RepID=A0A1F8H2A9_9BACT|nr:MAG: 30S ribosomal protein S2 [Candidatus Yanofskybacteria bacterium RIFCSPHIGHO2_01_FULL_45_42]OGN16149.1 MAG: 30S ribosomal protein S2 [Candidatus Yanofskybacteria bacterium RIFCSPHIGHO2_02_FULL_46_19]OGN26266.1 MAG: 30S ribosomal protein S2 [Candidatus Yanofskybacteria bacterium RIFCSPLOWO2_01_FULL_45_72]OGN31777.1 MAG: 30S ribosomal protein S2 [Candidatus Yanofskybacteria bacterium RIFCSPLOWO2_02_FULL_45_18]